MVRRAALSSAQQAQAAALAGSGAGRRGSGPRWPGTESQGREGGRPELTAGRRVSAVGSRWSGDDGAGEEEGDGGVGGRGGEVQAAARASDDDERWGAASGSRRWGSGALASREGGSSSLIQIGSGGERRGEERLGGGGEWGSG